MYRVGVCTEYDTYHICICVHLLFLHSAFNRKILGGKNKSEYLFHFIYKAILHCTTAVVVVVVTSV